ncbi:MAG: MsnO8 family LLM class oxidoreductase [Trebonia sp.]
MTRLPVSVLDLGIEPENRSPGQSVADVVAMARRADQLGFRRFWVAEHHGSRAVSGGVPAVMLARLAAQTASIRIGAGGVMLPNHSPVAVAEQFGTLGALDPGRVDLGIGRGPGSFDPGYIDALRLGAPPLSADGYASRIRELLGYLRADEARGVRVWLAEDCPPEPWLLSSSASGAALAAGLGLPVSFAYHIRPEITAESLAHYRDRFTPSQWRDRPHVMLSVGVTCAETDDQAAEMARSAQDMLGRRAAREHPQAGPEGAKARPRFLAGSVHGCPGTVARELAELVRRFAPDELIMVPVHATVTDRIRCAELMSEQVITD